MPASTEQGPPLVITMRIYLSLQAFLAAFGKGLGRGVTWFVAIYTAWALIGLTTDVATPWEFSRK